MPNQNGNAPPLDWQTCLQVLSPGGQQAIAEFIADFRTTHGPAWIEEMQETYPMATWLLDLACNHSADEAVDEIAGLFPLLPVRLAVGSQIRTLHARLKHEIEVKR